MYDFTGELISARYAGTRIGSAWLKAGGVRYAFGNNPTHGEQLIPKEDFFALKAAYPRDLIEAPRALSGRYIDLSISLYDSGLLREEEIAPLVTAGMVTVGMVLAASPEDINRIFASDPMLGQGVVEVLRYSYFQQEPDVESWVSIPAEGDGQEAVGDELTALPRVGAATERLLNDLGIATYQDVADRLTLEQWIAMSGKTEEGYVAVVEAARNRIGA